MEDCKFIPKLSGQTYVIEKTHQFAGAQHNGMYLYLYTKLTMKDCLFDNTIPVYSDFEATLYWDSRCPEDAGNCSYRYKLVFRVHQVNSRKSYDEDFTPVFLINNITGPILCELDYDTAYNGWTNALITRLTSHDSEVAPFTFEIAHLLTEEHGVDQFNVIQQQSSIDDRMISSEGYRIPLSQTRLINASTSMQRIGEEINCYKFDG